MITGAISRSTRPTYLAPDAPLMDHKLLKIVVVCTEAITYYGRGASFMNHTLFKIVIVCFEAI